MKVCLASLTSSLGSHPESGVGTRIYKYLQRGARLFFALDGRAHCRASVLVCSKELCPSIDVIRHLRVVNVRMMQ